MSARRIEMAGKKFGRLTVLGFAGHGQSMSALWKCRCDCGTEVVTLGRHLRSGDSQSCGCLHKERTAAACRKLRTTHGMSASRTFRIWGLMLNRCRNPRADNYKHYGGRGITVCARWWRFENFLADMGEAPDGKKLDRIDNDGNYELSNCRWLTQREQSNNRRDNVRVEAFGETMTVAEWSRRTGIDASAIYARLKRGWSPERALRPRC